MLTPEVAGLVVNWLPIIVFAAIFIAFSRSNRRRLDRYERHFAELLAVNREMAVTLADIRTLLGTERS